jgi:hypothetical protein
MEHAPSQPLMRPLLSQSQTPTASREGLSVFSGLVARRVAPSGGSPSLLWTGHWLGSQPFQPSTGRNTKLALLPCQCPFLVQAEGSSRSARLHSIWVIDRTSRRA